MEWRHQSEQVILVDEFDLQAGIAEKLHAHRNGLLHRAFSAFLFNRQGALLMQKRARGKYHSGGLWSNTCCGHPRPREPVEQAVHRRLVEEMQIDCELTEVLQLTYRTGVGRGLIEHEYDHVFVGVSNLSPEPDPLEVEDWRWSSNRDLRAGLRKHPGCYTAWFPLIWRALMAQRSVPARNPPVAGDRRR